MDQNAVLTQAFEVEVVYWPTIIRNVINVSTCQNPRNYSIFVDHCIPSTIVYSVYYHVLYVLQINRKLSTAS